LKGIGTDVAGEKGEDLAPQVVKADEARRAVKMSSFEVAKQALDSCAPRAYRATNGIADAHDFRDVPAGEWRFVVLRERSVRHCNTSVDELAKCGIGGLRRSDGVSQTDQPFDNGGRATICDVDPEH
jgi:hypothetical protein